MKKPTTERDGRALAIKMIKEMGDAMDDHGYSPSSIEAVYRPEGAQQDNVLLRYLDLLQRRGNREALAGFCSLLTDYISSGEEGCCPGDPEYYSSLTERDITGKPGPWPTMDDGDNERQGRPAHVAGFDSFMAKVLPGGEGAGHA